MQCIWPLAATLGEGPMWDARRGVLWFVDIKQGRVHRLDPATGDRGTIEVGGMPCFVLPADDGGYVLGNGHDLFRFDGEKVTGRIGGVAMPAANRFNDATVDPKGRIWFGSMDNDENAESGALHVHDAGAIHVAGGECCITNGPAVSGDGRWLYHVDTIGGVIWRFDIAEAPLLRDGTVFARIDPKDGNPDGIIIDAEDHVWAGLWGGWSVRRYAPDGALVQTVEFPVANVTKLAFGGPDLKTVYATTARQGLDDAQLAAQPLAGGLFSFRVDVPGVVLPEARL
ncbi:SMP-30/gluconolactonase/LRE family protein [Sphingomonas abietis]|uniref:SMP-30/gluconolactonase/LRE family protein n=1 Tax=Sphingomonas abietis TaxID=3012344 RepID=A0ABY7NP43_9SPHN|nr:SMP-30/gluconolactonase/LRE family protein [Sphingomonas abietis]WBO23304.1 SMP-30/gluconolactonase/LRE family protein [Sphingomonas abietis]